MSSEIEGLSDLHTFVKLGNTVSRFSFPHIAIAPTIPALIEREDGAIPWLDQASTPAATRRPSHTPKPRTKASGEVPLAVPLDPRDPIDSEKPAENAAFNEGTSHPHLTTAPGAAAPATSAADAI